MDKIKVSKEKFEEMGKIISCDWIIEKGAARGTVHFEGTEFVITSAVGNGNGTGGWKEVTGYRVVDKQKYKGTLEPLPYNAHYWEVDIGRRERGYTGMLIKYGNRQLVMIQPRVFVPYLTVLQGVLNF
jgi:hypothetical protein